MTSKLNIIITLFSGTTLQRFLKFGFRVFTSQLYCVMYFLNFTLQLPVKRTLASFYTWHPSWNLFVPFFSGTTLQWYLKFGSCLQSSIWVGVSSVSSSSQYHMLFLYVNISPLVYLMQHNAVNILILYVIF